MTTQIPLQNDLIACPECDLLQRVPPLARGERALCPRCGAQLRRGGGADLQLNLAFAVCVLVLLAIANGFPIMSLELEGRHTGTTVWQGVVALWQDNRIETAVLVLAFTLVVPLVRALAVVAITVPLLAGADARRHAGLFRFVTSLTPWGMTEVYLLGALVAFVKLGDLATVEPGPALYAFAALSVLSVLSTSRLDHHSVWRAAGE